MDLGAAHKMSWMSPATEFKKNKEVHKNTNVCKWFMLGHKACKIFMIRWIVCIALYAFGKTRVELEPRKKHMTTRILPLKDVSISVHFVWIFTIISIIFHSLSSVCFSAWLGRSRRATLRTWYEWMLPFNNEDFYGLRIYAFEMPKRRNSISDANADQNMKIASPENVLCYYANT